MNKLPWFTHDHSARLDEFIQRAEDGFGHFGYAAYFKILEMIHQHGIGGILTTTRARLVQNLRSRWPQVQQYLEFSRLSGKFQVTFSPDEVQIQNKKFIERQRKMKSKAPSKLLERSLKAPLEGEGEGEGERDNPIVPSRPAGARPVRQKLEVSKQFLAFWIAYPDCGRKVNKTGAWKVWSRKGLDQKLGRIVLALRSQKESRDWQKDDGAFIPLPVTWLNQERWEAPVRSIGNGGHTEYRLSKRTEFFKKRLEER